MKRTLALGLLLCVLLSSCVGGVEPEEPTTNSSAGNQPIVSAEDSSGKAGILILSDEQSQQITSMVLQSTNSITDAFTNGSHIPVYQMACFLYERMKLDGITQDFTRDAENETVLVPIEQVREYATTYFALSKVEFDVPSLAYFDGQFVEIPDSDADTEPDETDQPYDLTLDKIVTGSGKVTVTLALKSAGVDYQRWIYTLRAEKNGNVYFASMIKRPTEFGLYAVNNATAVLNKLIGVPVNAMTANQFHFMPFGEEMLAWYSNGKMLHVGYLNMDTFKSDQYVQIEGDQQKNSRFQVEPMGENIFVYRSDGVLILDKDLITVQTVPFPRAVLDMCDSLTKTLSLSPDMKYLAFTNTNGLYFFNLDSDETHLMQTNVVQAKGKSMIWEPIVFNPKSKALLARLNDDGKIDKFGILSTLNPNNALERTIRIRGDKGTLFSYYDDKLMAFAPTSARLDVKQDAPLEQCYAEFNLVTGTPRIVATDFSMPVTSDGTVAEGALLLTGEHISKTTPIQIGQDMVSSYSVKTFNKTTGKRTTLDFGYVDREGRLSLKAADTSGKMVAVCSGMFIHAVVVFQAPKTVGNVG